MRSKLSRHPLRHAASLATTALLAAATGCGVLGSSSDRSVELRTPAEPSTVAWAMAMLCRDAFPSADPRQGGPVPVTRIAPDTFEIAFGRSGPDDPYRCGLDGRLPAPSPELGADGTFGWRARRFAPAPCATIAPGHADRIEIEVRRAADGATAVRIDACGANAAPRLIRLLTAAVDVMTATLDTAELLRRGADRAVVARVESELERIDSEAIPGVGVLLAPLFAHLAAARLAQGDLPGARLALSSAIASAPQVPELRLRAADLDTRLARLDDAAQELEDVASNPGGGAWTRVAAGRARQARLFRPAMNSAIDAHSRARDLLAAGDRAAAEAWSRLAHQLAGDGAASLEIELARARGDHRTAYVLGVERMHRFGIDPKLALAMAEDAEQYGDPAAGLRLLARHWRTLHRVAPARLDVLAARLAALTGADLASRVAIAEDAGPLLARVLGDHSPDDAPAALPAARLASLRSIADRPLPGRRLPRDGYEFAPGVAPPR